MCLRFLSFQIMEFSNLSVGGIQRARKDQKKPTQANKGQKCPKKVKSTHLSVLAQKQRLNGMPLNCHSVSEPECKRTRKGKKGQKGFKRAKKWQVNLLECFSLETAFEWDATKLSWRFLTRVQEGKKGQVKRPKRAKKGQ